MTTIRMQNIPLDTHKRQLLRKCLNMNFPNWMTPDNLVQVFLGFSQEVVLSSSLELSPDNSKTMTGTITLRNMSEVQKLLEVDEFSLSEGNAFPVESTRRVAIDTHFHGLTVIAGGDDSKLDIIAIHGLNGHAFNSWTVDDGVMWLRDLLPAQVPDARVLLYGYNANVIEDASRSRIQEHARLFIKFLQGLAEIQKRRVIFICHSLGGLVLKQALVFIRNERVYSTLRDVALGVIFLGTPHGGSAHADIAQVLVNITRISFRANTNQLLSGIQKDSPSLMDLAHSFKEFHSELKIASFCEQLSMKLPGPFSTDLGLVVDQRSATIADEPPIPLVVREVKRMAMGIVTSMPL
ncbi:Alpha/Beta hydrolase protein [Russula earlei]|uniref:Alpha/Beta hydrolase protein n=1 Tax=Russula earlei TaxID=71964 RepID=A0ACC0TWE0_9AGAM|nr:Alpha/Beta hydrolase protein [Russula earlei]